MEEIAGKCGIVDPVGYAIFINRWGNEFSLNDKGGGKGEKGMHIMDAISKADAKMPPGVSGHARTHARTYTNICTHACTYGHTALHHDISIRDALVACA